ncbi:MAG: alpha/beta fold hydrolase [Alphaproteobacteria bacterium]|nr:alpha/beta fold hydrolase [Alphaproteobacteria bacterium]
MLRLIALLMALAAAGYWLWRTGDAPLIDEIANARNETGADFESRKVKGADGVELHVVFAGPANGEPVILIHGFPEFWYSWRHQAAALAEAGFRVAIPDLRGYNRSDKPKARENYQVADYAADIVAVLDAQNWPQANIAGHDIGAIVAWKLIFDHSSRVDRAVVFNIAPPEALAAAVAAGGASTSWYRTAFKAPFLPEFALRAGGYRILKKTLREGAAGGFTEADLDIYASAWARDNAVSTMLGFYRADGLNGAAPQMYARRPAPPTLFVAAGLDPYVPAGAIELAREVVGERNVELWPNTGHWVLQQEQDMTVDALTRWLGGE